MRKFSKKQKLAVALVQGVDPEGLDADHIRPHSKGGETTVENCQLIAPTANRKKGNKFMELRKWQQLFMKEWQKRTDHPFLLVAMPGSGKTFAALTAAKQWMQAGNDRRLIVVVPSDNLRTQWRREALALGLDLQTKEFYGHLKSEFHGVVATFQLIAGSPLIFRKLCSDQSVMVILDEVHHCGDQASFGYGIKTAFELAKERLLLSGTPWKTNGEPIPFIRYDGDGYPVSDFRYDYPDALTDDVVRWMHFFGKGGLIKYEDSEIVEEMNRDISDEEAGGRLKRLLNPQGDFVRGQIRAAHAQLIKCRGQMSNAAAMAACIDKDHAYQTAKIIKEETGCEPVVIVSDEAASGDKITAFRTSNAEWLVSIRQVSEGTDIKRLQVLCYLTNYATEVFFRQIIGRVCRRDQAEDFDAFVYLPNDPRLLRFADNIMQAQGIALREQIERNRLERETSEREVPPYNPYTTELSGDDINSIAFHEYPELTARCIQQIAYEIGIPLEKAARVVEMMPEIMAKSQQAATSQSPEISKEESLEILRRECNKKVNYYHQLTGLDYKEIHGKFKPPQAIMTAEQLQNKKRQLNEWIKDADRGRGAAQ